ncbi:ABC transporter permease subunit [Mycoplasmopsis gallopavonis]|uniref:Maltose transport system permease protein malF n=1 Tax=Mycoplasmopsis gallopavonis TaxID=76629 RepID=A0A449AYT3_9BACT|nr:ABC transporter permease subunit [Mycoplasmopsis gallopavonis]RIV16373.1 ABC transporter permease subunit [Mycoplasmopsis gallopavonis]VEU72635.1 Maltose transport system permease protein malF [Mycoplasmopsis gallopavonis]VEU72900.1 Maltose transport system permease protein malF [Mycoplasmopsis gallopavonis]
MEKLKLYNWYGEAFDAKLPETSNNLKAYKHQVNNVFTRLSDNLKTRNNIDKDLFLRAKTKIQDNLKRELNSHQVAYQNKIKVYKDSIKKLSFVNKIESLLEFELKKLKTTKRNNKKYVKDFIYSLENSGDNLNDKLANIEKLESTMNASEAKMFQKYCLFNALLTYLRKFDDLEFNFNKLKKYLVSEEISFLEKHPDPGKFLQEFYSKLEAKRLKMLAEKDRLIKKYQQTKKLQHELYRKERANIILLAKQKIVELENEFNLKTEQNKLRAIEYKDEALSKIKLHKETILKNEKHNQKIVQQIKLKGLNRRKELRHLFAQYKQIQILKFEIRNIKDFLNFLQKEGLKFELPDFGMNHLSYKELQEKKDNLLKIAKSLKFEGQKLVLYQIAMKHFFSCLNLLGVRKEALALWKSQYLEQIAKTYQNYSYEADFKFEQAKANKDWFIDAYKTRHKFLVEKIQAQTELAILKQNGEIDQEKKFAKAEFDRISKEYQANLNSLQAKIKAKEISKQAFANKKIEYKIKAKEAKYTVKLQSKVLRNKSILRTLFIRKSNEQKINKKIYESKINEAQKTIPVETFRNIKFLASFMGLVLPGLPELVLFKQYAKGILMVLFSILVWSAFVPFALGAYWGKMDGIFGFSDLGYHKFVTEPGSFPDARYYLFGGVVSVIVLIISIIYLVVSSIGAYRVAKSLYQGSRPSRWSHTKRWMQTSGFPWMISIFGWVLMVFIVVSPVVTSILLSFTNFGFNHQAPTQSVSWVGLQQWGKWWIFRNANLLSSIGNVMTWTLIWTFASTVLPICLGILIAILTNNSRLKGKKFFRLIFILPWAIPAFVTLGFIKNMFASGETGLINFILGKLFGMNPRSWLQEIGTARILVILVQTWIGYAWIFMLVTGNLQSIPKDIYEAGSVDGAKGKHLFWYLTLPSLLLAIAPMLIGQFVAAFNNFTTISIFTGGGPSYAYSTTFGEASTDIIISWVYKLTNGTVKIDGNQAFGAALATLASLFSIGLAARGFIKSMSRRD